MDFDWNRARAFLAAVEAGSFSAGGQVLGVSQPTVGRYVSALEEELGVVLFERIGNRVRLTEVGRQLAGHARAMRDAADRFAITARGRAASLTGSVRISATDSTSVALLPPIVARLRQSHPGIVVHVVTTNEASDLLRREADIAIRNFQPTEPELIARRLADGRANFFATPAYLDGIGRPTRLADFGRAGFVSFAQVEPWVAALAARGWPVTADNVVATATNHQVQWELCRAGVGIAVASESLGDADPVVERALPGLDAWLVPTWLVSHRELRTTPRIRVVFDALAEAL